MAMASCEYHPTLQQHALFQMRVREGSHEQGPPRLMSGSPYRGTVVKARDKFRHPGCFVCSDCDMNLKQKGYFFVEGQLYCETHARTRTRPPEGHDLITAYPM